MSSMLPLGRTLNLGRSASGGNVRFSLRNCSGVLFTVDTPANASTLTLTEQNAPTGGTSQALNGGAAGTVYEYYTQTAGVWTRVTTGISGNVITVSGTPDVLAVYVNQGAPSDGFPYISANHSAKPVLAIMSDLDVKRKPANLVNVSA